MAFLGLDVGGTHWRSEWWPAGAHPGADGDGVQIAANGGDAALTALAAALQRAAGDVVPEAAVCAVAGAGDAAIARALADGLRARGVAFPIAVVGDVLAAAAAGLKDGPGVLLWSGTGSFVVARGEDGALHRTGGRGWLLGDQGSGYDLVRRAAAAVLLAADELAPRTALTEALVAAFDAPSPARLGAALQQLQPARVAAQLPVVLDAAVKGDRVADAVIDAGVDGLSMLAAAAVRRAGLEWRDLPVAFGGGVLTSAPAVTERLAEWLESLRTLAPRTLDPRDAARGAAWLAHGWFHRERPQHEWVTGVAL